MSFSAYLQILIDRHKMGVNELADIAGISAGHLSRVLSGKRPPPGPKTLKKLALVLEEDYNQMLKEAGHLENNITDSTALNKLKDLETFLLNNEVTFRRILLSSEQKKLLTRILEAILFDK